MRLISLRRWLDLIVLQTTIHMKPKDKNTTLHAYNTLDSKYKPQLVFEDIALDKRHKILSGYQSKIKVINAYYKFLNLFAHSIDLIRHSIHVTHTDNWLDRKPM